MITKKDIPNLLTVGRGIMTMIMVGMFYVEGQNKFWIILALFLTASITDFFDGMLARKYHWESNFGIVFDSMLDKVLILTMMLLLASYQLIPSWVWALFLIRELVVDSIKGFLNAEGRPVKPRWSGKFKMVAQVGLVASCLISLEVGTEWWANLNMILAGVALILSYYSGFFYVRGFLKRT